MAVHSRGLRAPRAWPCVGTGCEKPRLATNFTAFYPFCPIFRHQMRGTRPILLVFRTEDGEFEVGLSKRFWPRSVSIKLPSLIDTDRGQKRFDNPTSNSPSSVRKTSKIGRVPRIWCRKIGQNG